MITRYFKQTIKAKLFVKRIMKTILLLVFLVCGINFFIDPLYTWQGNGKINLKRKDFDERIQKTNFLANINNNYDAILLGNSRSTYLDSSRFNLGVNIYNYSVNAMSIYEYDQVILNFIELTGNEPKVILIGIDPFDFPGNKTNSLKEILDNRNDLIQKTRNLLSLDMFKFSLETIIKTFQVDFNVEDRKQRYYDNNLIKGSTSQNIISNEKYIKTNSNNLIYDVDFSLFEEYRKLKEKYKNSKFIVYCLPFHKDLIEDWQKDNKFYEKNEKFIYKLLDIFHEVYYFNYMSSYNSSYFDYYDTYYFYPYLGNIIVDNINELYVNKKADFGYIINKDNYKLGFK